MPRWCVIYRPQLPYSHRCTRTLYGSIRHIGSIIHIGVGSCVARFGRMGNAKASDRGASNSMQGFTLFLCLYLKYITAVL